MINLVNLSGYEIPKAVEDKRKEWVAYGDDNNYYGFLVETYLQSATNNAAIKSISDLIYGEGLCIDGLDKDSKEVKELYKMIPQKDLRRIVLDRKMLGQAAVQVIYKGRGDNRKIAKIKHFPIQTLRPEKMDSMGVVNNYYYHPNWTELKRTDKLKKIPSWGTSKEAVEIYCIKPYTPNYYYFSPVDYTGAIPYAEIENEVSDYLLNEVKNSFSGTKVVNFNNGIPDPEQRELIARDVKAKLTGARGEKLIIAFNDDETNKTTVDDLTIDNAPEHYSYLADEARNKILVGHRITSPMLLGIKDTNNGLGNNADEIKTASQLFNSTVINNFQEEITDALEEILLESGIELDLYFITAQPIEFEVQDEEAEEVVEEADVEETTEEESDNAEEQKEDTQLSANFNPEQQVDWLSHLSKLGETEEELGEDFVMVHEEKVTDEEESEDYEGLFNSVNLELSGDNRQQESSMDSKWIKVRYKYVTDKSLTNKTGKSRGFCQSILSQKKIYRKEDIIAMKGMNSSHGHKGRPYSIFLYKGGVNCSHYWLRQIYIKKEKADGTPWGGGALNGVKAVTEEQAKKFGFNKNASKFRQNKNVSKAPKTMKDNGHHPNYMK